MKGILRLQGLPTEVDTFSERLVEAFLEEYTRPGDVVFDPFAGSGTTMIVAERMGRRPLGLEILPDLVDQIRRRLTDASAIRCADARTLDQLDLPVIDFSITSPPYMTRIAHPENPLNGYRSLDGDYQTYLAELADIYRQLRRRLAPDATVVINAANLRQHQTRLAWDIERAVSDVLVYQQEVVIDWQEPHEWYTNDYCLVFGT